MLIQWARLSFLCLPPARENPHRQVPADVPSAGAVALLTRRRSSIPHLLLNQDQQPF